MNKILFVLVVVFFVSANQQTLQAQDFPKLDKSPMDAAAHPKSYRVSDKLAKIIYSRPQLKGRSLSRLAPNGKVWRTGANEAPEVTFYKNVMFGDKEVKAGTYTLFTIPNEGSWTIILSNQINVWGAYFYNESEDVVRAEAKVSNLDQSVEAFSILFTGDEVNSAILHFAWGTTLASIPVTAK